MAKLLSNLGDKPLWGQLYEILLKRIDTGYYEIDQILPSEGQFMEEFEVSRITVRQAMNKLLVENRIARKRGKGTIVLAKQNKISTIFQSSFQSVKEDTDNFLFDLKWVKIVTAPMEVKSFFNLTNRSKVVCVNRQGKNSQGMILSEHISYISPIVSMNEYTDFTKSLYFLYEKHGFSIDSVSEEITASIPSAKEKLELEIGNRKMAIIIRARKGFHGNEPVEYTVSKYLGEGYALYVNNI